MNPLDYSDFISHINEKIDNDAVSVFITQIKTPAEIANEILLKYRDSKPLEPELMQKEMEKEFNQELEKIRSEHWGRLSALPPTELTIYLSFHYKIYLERHPGRELDFLSFIAEDLEVLRRKENIHEYISENRFKIINEWIEGKRKELEPSTVPDQSKKKTYITHPQQVLLFHELGIITFLKDKFNLGHEQTAEIISLLANRGKDNTGDYIRSLDLPKERTAKSKRNLYAQTPGNVHFVDQIMKKLIPSE